MADMKTITIDGVTYDIMDDNAQTRLATAESNIQGLQSGKADAEDVPTKVSDLTDDVGIVTDIPVEDVEIDGASIVGSKTASIPRAAANKAGVIKFDPSTEAGTNYVDIYANEQNPSRVPLLDSNNLLTANQMPAATTNEKGALSAADKTKLNGLRIPTTSVLTLTVANWSNDSQTILAEGVTETNNILITPTPAALEDYTDAGIKCMSQGTGNLTFTCELEPVADIDVQVMILTS